MSVNLTDIESLQDLQKTVRSQAWSLSFERLEKFFGIFYFRSKKMNLLW